MPQPPPDPAVRKKIRTLQLFGIPAILGLFALVIASSLGYVPDWIFAPAACVEAIVGGSVLWRIHRLRNP